MTYFTTSNTEGFTEAQLDAMNNELAARTRSVPDNDIEMLEQVRKSIADEFTNRSVAP